MELSNCRSRTLLVPYLVPYKIYIVHLRLTTRGLQRSREQVAFEDDNILTVIVALIVNIMTTNDPPLVLAKKKSAVRSRMASKILPTKQLKTVFMIFGVSPTAAYFVWSVSFRREPNNASHGSPMRFQKLLKRAVQAMGNSLIIHRKTTLFDVLGSRMISRMHLRCSKKTWCEKPQT